MYSLMHWPVSCQRSLYFCYTILTCRLCVCVSDSGSWGVPQQQGPQRLRAHREASRAVGVQELQGGRDQGDGPALQPARHVHT
jgi:hypothetical protein